MKLTKIKILATFITFSMVACNGTDDSKRKELELREKEVELKEREIKLEERETELSKENDATTQNLETPHFNEIEEEKSNSTKDSQIKTKEMFSLNELLTMHNLSSTSLIREFLSVKEYKEDNDSFGQTVLFNSSTGQRKVMFYKSENSQIYVIKDRDELKNILNDLLSKGFSNYKNNKPNKTSYYSKNEDKIVVSDDTNSGQIFITLTTKE